MIHLNSQVQNIIEESPLFKVCFPSSIRAMGVDLSSEKDSSGVSVCTIKDGKVSNVQTIGSSYPKDNGMDECNTDASPKPKPAISGNEKINKED